MLSPASNHSSLPVARAANHSQNPQLGKETLKSNKVQTAPISKKLLGLAVGLFAVAGMGVVAYANRGHSQRADKDASRQVCLHSEQLPINGTSQLRVDSQLVEHPKHLKEKRLAEYIAELNKNKQCGRPLAAYEIADGISLCEKELIAMSGFAKRKPYDFWPDDWELSLPGVSKKSKACRGFYIEADKAAAKVTQNALNRLGYQKVFEKATQLGLKPTENGFKANDLPAANLTKNELEQLNNELEQLNEVQKKAMDLSSELSKARDLHRTTVRKMTSFYAEKAAQFISLRSNFQAGVYSIEGLEPSFYMQKYGYNATAIAEAAARTNAQVDRVLGM